ncbi:MAG: ATP-binding cassette, subfamily B, bacterial [Candidatus Peregrinibacteria bacterium Greene0416_19]|nr:MAG: ATP-binding cassette, subfamily B, bacterial [Candidatus Peregrinibacteria bacterium Greene0416_19]
MMRRMHADVFAKVQRLSTNFHVNSFAGANARKIGRGVERVEDILDRVWFNFLPAVALAIGFTVVLFRFAPLIGVIMLGGMGVYATLSISLNLYLSKYYAWVDEADTRMNASTVDTLTANTLVKSFGAEEREDRRHDGFLREWQRRQWRTWNTATAVYAIQLACLLAIELAVFLTAIRLWQRGDFTAGGFIVIVFYVGQLWGRLLDIGRNIRDFLRSLAHCQEMVALWNRPFHVQDRPGAHPLRVTGGLIEFDRVKFRYEQQGRAIFEDFSVTIRPGERVALVGHSGGGKSSFVKLLLRFYDIDSGVIRIDGQDIATVTQESLRTAIAMVPQDPILFHRTIAENIAYGRIDATEEEVRRAAALAHAAEFIERLPKTYDTLVGERGVKLSGGERQRVAIARAILAGRPILVLDEATSSLDSVSEGYIQDGLHVLMQGRTSIVIAHRLSTIKSVDRILVIEHGKIVEQGTHAELVAREGGMYRQLYELQAGGFIGE